MSHTLYLLDKNEKIQSVISSDIYNFSYTNKIADGSDDTGKLNKIWMETLSFQVPSINPDATLIETGSRLILVNDDSKLKMFTVYSKTEEVSGGIHLVSIEAYNSAIWDLYKTYSPAAEFPNAEPVEVFTVIFNNTGWNLTDIYKPNKTWSEPFSISEGNKQAAVDQALTLFESEVEAWVEMDEASSQVKKFARIVQRVGEDRRHRFEYRHNVTGLSRQQIDTDFFTRLYVYGGTPEGSDEPISIAPANNGVKFITDYDANDKWNEGNKTIDGIITNEKVTNSNALLAWAKEQMKYYNHPKFQYTVDVALFQEKPMLGDTVVVVDFEMEPALTIEARVIEVTKTENGPRGEQVVLGEFTTVVATTPTAILKLQALAQEALEATKELAKENIIKSATAPVASMLNQLWLDTSTDPNMLKRWNGLTWVKIADDGKKALEAMGIAERAEDKADKTLVDFENLNSANVITPVEKVYFNRQWKTIKNTYAEIKTNATTYGVSTEPLTTAYNNLSTAIGPVLVDLVANTVGSVETLTDLINAYFEVEDRTQRTITFVLNQNIAGVKSTAETVRDNYKTFVEEYALSQSILDQSIDDLETEIGEAQGSIGTITGEIGTINTNLGTINGKITGINTDLSTMTTRFTGVDTAINAVKTDVSAITTRIGTAETGLTTITTSVNGLVTQVSNIEGDISEVVQTASGLATRVGTTESGLSTLTQTAAGLRTDVNKKVDTTTYNSYVTQTATALQSKLSATDAASTYATQSSLTQTASGIQSQVSGIDGRLGTAESTITQQAGLINSKVSTSDFTSALGAKEDGIVKSATAPTHAEGKLWLDTTKAPNILKRSTGTAWVNVSPTTAAHVAAYSTTQGNALAGRVSTTETNITQANNAIQLKAEKTYVDTQTGLITADLSTLTTSVNGIEGRVSTAEGNLSTVTQTANSLTTQLSTTNGNVSALTQTANGLATKVATAEGNISTLTQTTNGLATKVSTAEGNISTLSQTAGGLQTQVTNVKQDLDNLGGRNLILNSKDVTLSDLEKNDFFKNTKMIVTDPSDSIYSTFPNPPMGAVFNNYNPNTRAITKGLIDFPPVANTVITLINLYEATEEAVYLERAKLIGDYILSTAFTSSFYGSMFYLIPNRNQFKDGAWQLQIGEINIRTQYQALWAMSELFRVTQAVKYKDSATQLMKTVGNVYNNINSRVTDGELDSYMSGASYDLFYLTGTVESSTLSFSWNQFNQTNIDVMANGIKAYIAAIGNTSITDQEGTAFIPNAILTGIGTHLKAIYNNGMLTMTPTGLPYSFLDYGTGCVNWDWVDTFERGDTWFANDAVLWIIDGLSNLGKEDATLKTIATAYRNKFLALRSLNHPTYKNDDSEVLFYDRYNFDGSYLQEDPSLSISATAIFWIIDENLNIVDEDLHSKILDTLKLHQIKATGNSMIDGSFGWDASTKNSIVEVKATGEIWHSKFLHSLTGDKDGYLIKTLALSEDLTTDEYTIALKGSIAEGKDFNLHINNGDISLGLLVKEPGTDIYKLTFSGAAVTSGNEKSIRLYDFPNNGAFNSTIKWIKLEKGGIATDWTPAPEDIEKSLSTLTQTAYGLATRVENAEGNISTLTQTANGIQTQVSAVSVNTIEQLDSLSETLDSKASNEALGIIGEDLEAAKGVLTVQEERISSVEQTATDVTTTVSTLQTTVNDNAEVVSKVETYMNFSEDGLQIGKSDSDMNVNISNTEIQFLDNGAKVSYINGQKMYITQTEVLESMIIGNHKFEKSPTSTTITWIG